MLSACGRLQRAALAGCLLLNATSSEAQPPIQQVLVLQSFARGNLTLDYFTGNFRVDLERRAGRAVSVVQIVVGRTGFVDAPEQAVVDYIRATFSNRSKPDLIVAVAGPATVFARKYREELFPDTPLLSAAVDQRFVRDVPSSANETTVAMANDFSGIVDDILQLLPLTRRVFVVTGSGPFGQFWQRELQNQFKRFGERLEFVWSDDLPLPEILRRCAMLPKDSAILYVNFGTDAQGGDYADERVFTELHAKASVPIFASLSPLLGHGIVGGRLVSIDDVNRSATDVATRILNGASPGNIVVPPQPPGQPVFDWNEIDKWGIPESRLPPGSSVRYRPRSLWQVYRGTVLSAVGVLAVQSLLIVGLLYQRRARQRAEVESRRNLALAADASRRQTMSVLTSSIAHELGQPISSMIHNAQALEMMITADGATRATLGEIISDIRSQGIQATRIIDRHRTMLRSRQLDKKPIDLHAVISESLALVGHDMTMRQVEATVNLSSSPCIIGGDPVLLQQVLVNLVINALDAMAETPPTRRRVTIGTEVRASDVAVSVRDTGTGLPAHMNGNGALFTPFVTTKSNGLGMGLAIAQTIVDAHGGTLDARNNPEGGATFTVTLRRSETTAILPGSPDAA